MWLDELNELVRRLGERIEKHGDVLSRNETATRYGLIDPLLTALGWDLQDPGQVRTEYNPDGAGGRRTDYTMFTGEDMKKPQIVIEAKKLGTPIGDEVISQTIGYCIREGIPYFAVTNGSDWEIYPTFGGAHVRITEKRIVDFSLTDPAQAAVMKMLWLWRGNFESGSPIMPVVPDRPAPPQAATSTSRPATATPPSDVERPERGRVVPLGEFNPRTRERPPAALLFPDGTEKKVVKWFEAQTSVVEWLLATGRLTEADCPVRSAGGRQILVSTHPTKSNGKKFESPRQIGDVWIDTTKSGSDHIKALKSILEARNVDLSDVRVVMRT